MRYRERGLQTKWSSFVARKTLATTAQSLITSCSGEWCSQRSSCGTPRHPVRAVNSSKSIADSVETIFNKTTHLHAEVQYSCRHVLIHFHLHTNSTHRGRCATQLQSAAYAPPNPSTLQFKAPHRYRYTTSWRDHSDYTCSWMARVDTRGPSWALHTAASQPYAQQISSQLHPTSTRYLPPSHLAAAVVSSVPVLLRLGAQVQVEAGGVQPRHGLVAVLQLVHEAARRVRHHGHGPYAVVHHPHYMGPSPNRQFCTQILHQATVIIVRTAIHVHGHVPVHLARARLTEANVRLACGIRLTS